MTEEQAVDFIFRQAPGQPSKVQAANWVRTFVSLGMLKLDEPKPQETLWKILRSHGVPLDVAQWVCNDALNAGLKIVEK